MLKTVIGSWPIFYADNEREAIRQSIQDQVDVGIELVSDGQTRNYMVEYFARLIEGFTCQKCPIEFCNKDCGTGPEIIGRINYDEVFDDVVIEDLEYAVEESPVPVKGIITGPTTLVNCSKLSTDDYRGLYDEDLFLDLSMALERIANNMLDVGVQGIQIDEPFLSVGSPTHLAKLSLEHMAKNIQADISLHVCGDVHREIQDSISGEERSIFDIIMGFKGINSVSFSVLGYPQNKRCLAKYIGSAPPKKIMVGCIRTDDERIESVKEVYELLRYASWALGEENVIAAPDCGMKILSRDIAKRKLAVMCEAARKLEQEKEDERGRISALS